MLLLIQSQNRRAYSRERNEIRAPQKKSGLQLSEDRPESSTAAADPASD